MVDDKLLMPKTLTAENGAKALLRGEFFEEAQVPNPDYCTCGECTNCLEGSTEEAYITRRVTVSWSTIKDIYKMIAATLGVDYAAYLKAKESQVLQRMEHRMAEAVAGEELPVSVDEQADKAPRKPIAFSDMSKAAQDTAKGMIKYCNNRLGVYTDDKLSPICRELRLFLDTETSSDLDNYGGFTTPPHLYGGVEEDV